MSLTSAVKSILSKLHPRPKPPRPTGTTGGR